MIKDNNIWKSQVFYLSNKVQCEYMYLNAQNKALIAQINI